MGHIDQDGVIILHQADQSSIITFRRDMPDHKTMCASTKTAVGDECDATSQSRANDGGGGFEHFGHTRCTLGPFVLDHHHVSWTHSATGDTGNEFFLPIKYPSRSLEPLAFLARYFSHAAFFGQISVEDLQVTGVL